MSSEHDKLVERGRIDGERFGWRVFHIPETWADFGNSKPGLMLAAMKNERWAIRGWPDLIFIRENEMVAVEMKTGRSNPTRGQVAWLKDIAGCGCRSGIITPATYPNLFEVLSTPPKDRMEEWIGHALEREILELSRAEENPAPYAWPRKEFMASTAAGLAATVCDMLTLLKWAPPDKDTVQFAFQAELHRFWGHLLVESLYRDVFSSRPGRPFSLLSRCAVCDAEIVWVPSRSCSDNRPLTMTPIHRDPSPVGTVALRGYVASYDEDDDEARIFDQERRHERWLGWGRAYILEGDELDQARRQRRRLYVAHVTTCPTLGEPPLHLNGHLAA